MRHLGRQRSLDSDPGPNAKVLRLDFGTKVGSTVYFLPDKDDKDPYGPFLRYVWAENGEFFNDKAVRLGYAKAVLYMPNDLYIYQMQEAESEARSTNEGYGASRRTDRCRLENQMLREAEDTGPMRPH